MPLQRDCPEPATGGKAFMRRAALPPRKQTAVVARCGSLKSCLMAYAAGLAFTALASGCSRPIPAGMLRVRGEVRYQGQPLPDGVIMLEAVEGKGSAAGRILSGGAFEAIVSPGEYQVAVRSLDGVATYDRERKLVKPKSRIPERYGSIATSGLKLTVTPRGDRLAVSLEE